MREQRKVRRIRKPVEKKLKKDFTKRLTNGKVYDNISKLSKRERLSERKIRKEVGKKRKKKVKKLRKKRLTNPKESSMITKLFSRGSVKKRKRKEFEKNSKKETKNA